MTKEGQMEMDDFLGDTDVASKESDQRRHEVITLNPTYDKCRRTLTLGYQAYEEWAKFVAVYYNRGAVMNAALMYFIKEVTTGRVELVDPYAAEAIDMKIVNDYL